jgi:hypothetical protein
MFYELRVFPWWTLESTAVVSLLHLVSHNEIKIAMCYDSYWTKTALTHNTVLPLVCQMFFLWRWLRTVSFNIVVGCSKTPVRWSACRSK